MTNHHKLLFLQNSDIPNHLSTDVRGGAQVTPRSCLKLADLETYPASSSVSKRKHELLKPGKLQFEPLINTVKHLRISLAIEISTDCPLFSQSISPHRFPLTQAPISDFLTHFPMDFNVGFLDRFRWRISCARGCHTLHWRIDLLRAVIGCASPNIHDE